jgi:hypothetical protein
MIVALFSVIVIIPIILLGCKNREIIAVPSPSPMNVIDTLEEEFVFIPLQERNEEWARKAFNERYFTPDSIESVTYSISKKINAKEHLMDFILYGFLGISAEEKKMMINTIEIKQDGIVIQTIDNLSTVIYRYIDDCGFSLDDWNFDGTLDLSLQKVEGGSASNRPTLFFLWNSSKREFVKNDELENLSSLRKVYLDVAYPRTILSFQRAGFDSYGTDYYSFENGILLPQRRVSVQPMQDENGNWSNTVERVYNFENDDWILISENPL